MSTIKNVNAAVNLIIAGALHQEGGDNENDIEVLAAILAEIQTVCDQWGENLRHK